MDDPFTHCEALVRDADRDRYLASLFAPPDRRRALMALYAFNLEISRVRALVSGPMPGEIRLQWWSEVLGGSRLSESKANPVADALIATVTRFGLPVDVLLHLIEARRFDLYDDGFASIQAFEHYATATAGALFDLSARVLGNRAEPPKALVSHAGVAAAIAELLQMFPVHTARGQFLIPLDIAGRYGLAREELHSAEMDVPLRAALAELRLQARRHLEAAREGLAAVPEAMLPAFLPLALVRPTLQRMERRGYDPFAPRPLPQWRRQWIIWRAARHPRRMF